MHKKLISLLVFLVSLGLIEELRAQSETTTDNWDNVLYYSNKLAWGSDDWRHTAEFQVRFRDDISKLEQWHIEYAATYLVAENIEIVPDFRYTRKPTRSEYRPGFGIVFKQFTGKTQIVHQVKYQYDVRTNSIGNSQGARYAFFLNRVYNGKWVGSAVVGGLYEWGPDFTGFLGLRAGFAAAYIFNEVHSINIAWFYGLLNDKNGDWTHVGIPSFQLIINIRKKYKYTPAKYISF